MVYLKVFQIKNIDRLYRSVHYILDEAKTLENVEELDGDFPLIVKENQLYRQLASGHHIGSPAHAADEMVLTKRFADQHFGRKEKSDLVTGKGVLAHHIIQSFSPDDNLTPEEIHEIGRKTVMELTGGHYEFVMATHTDTDHIHNHIIFSSTSVETLKKFRWEKGTTEMLFNITNKHADLAGAKILDRKSSIDYSNYFDYGAYRRKFSFKREIKARLDFLLQHSTSLSDFLEKAKAMDIEVDFSGKYATYRLIDYEQKRNTRDSTLSKKGMYSLDRICQRIEKNKTTHSVETVRSEYEKMVQERETDFEMRLTIEPWQVSEKTATGIYLTVTYGLGNQGMIKIPNEKVDEKDDGKFELFLKRFDYFYLMNEEHSEKNRFIRGDTLMKQLAYNNGQVILNKHPYISKLDVLIKEFEFLSKYEVTSPEQFEELANRLIQQLNKAEETLSILEQRIEKFNKISSALLAFEEGSLSGMEVFERYQVDPNKLHRGRLEKKILETDVERQVLKDKIDSIIGESQTFEKVRDHAYHRQNEKYI